MARKIDSHERHKGSETDVPPTENTGENGAKFGYGIRPFRYKINFSNSIWNYAKTL